MNADEIAFRNQKISAPYDWSAIGVTGLSKPAREISEGQIPSFWSPLLRNQVDGMRFLGHDIEIWIGRGWVYRKFLVKGTPHAVASFRTWFNSIRRT